MRKQLPKRYPNCDVAEAVHLSKSVITAYASMHGFSTRDGWEIQQIIDLLNGDRKPRSSRPVNMDNVTEIRAALAAFGYVFDDPEEDDEYENPT